MTQLLDDAVGQLSQFLLDFLTKVLLLGFLQLDHVPFVLDFGLLESVG